MVGRLCLVHVLLALVAVHVPALSVKPQSKRTKQEFEVDDPCFLLLQPPKGRALPGSRVPCVVHAADQQAGRYSISLATAVSKVDLVSVPAYVLHKAESDEYTASLRSFTSNTTMATLAARIALADNAKRSWLAEQRRNGLPDVKERREDFYGRADGAWRDGWKLLDEKVRKDARLDNSEDEARTLEYQARRAHRAQKVEPLQTRLRKTKPWRSKDRQKLLALLKSLQDAQSLDDEEERLKAEAKARLKEYSTPGIFKLRFNDTKVTKGSAMGTPVTAVLPSGALVHVHLVSDSEGDGRVRGMIDEPLGWVTLYAKSARVVFAERVGEILVNASATCPAEPHLT
uniref:Uncharacterized protein n=1 Tax=Alexandrium catenella TaxID=2925 RepID=A0A7S1S7Z7_ALECA